MRWDIRNLLRWISFCGEVSNMNVLQCLCISGWAGRGIILDLSPKYELRAGHGDPERAVLAVRLELQRQCTGNEIFHLCVN